VANIWSNVTFNKLYLEVGNKRVKDSTRCNNLEAPLLRVRGSEEVSLNTELKG
jgi:hypothetical protein